MHGNMRASVPNSFTLVTFVGVRSFVLSAVRLGQVRQDEGATMEGGRARVGR